VSAYRVVTLTGPGGVGKTSLALESARGLVDEFEDGGWLIELASLSDPNLVPSAVAHALEMTLGGEQITAQTVARTVAGRNLLLVLDNCEHVVDAVADLAEMLVRLCPRTTIMATSREALRIEGEYIFRVPPLEVPTPDNNDPDHILVHSAVELFVDRARASDQAFIPTSDSLRAIAAICRQLDGIPLAIEFAAARVVTLGLDQVASGLHDRFVLLTSGRRTAALRQRTLRATLDWSYDLLTDVEQRLLRYLAIFRGGFTLPAAIAVVHALDGAESQIEKAVSGLVNKSLVTLDRTGSVPRWVLLETIRAYALEKLIISDESNAAARRHAMFYRNLFVRGEPASRLQMPGEDMASYTSEIDNVRAALDWCFSAVGDVQIGVSLTAAFVPAWVYAALPAECRERTERALDNLSPDVELSAPLRMQLHFAFGLMPAYTMSPAEPAKVALAKALGYAEQIGDLPAQFQILWGLWVLNTTAGECNTSQLIVDRLLLVAQRIGDASAGLMVQRLQGFILQQKGEHPQARRCFDHVLRHYVVPTDVRLTAWGQFDQRVLSRAMLARGLWFQGYPDQAIDQARLSFDEAQQTDFPLSIGEALRVALCDVALMTGDLATADQAISMLIDIAAKRNAPFWGISGRCLQGKLAVVRGEFAQAVEILRAELGFCEQVHWPIWYPEFMCALAEGLAGLGEITEALSAVAKGLASADQGGERIWYPELLRLKGELLLRQGLDQFGPAAEDSIAAGLRLAREQGALSFELRAALSLARLRVSQSRGDEAKAILMPIYDRFTEGFGSADLQAAGEFLGTIQRSAIPLRGNH